VGVVVSVGEARLAAFSISYPMSIAAKDNDDSRDRGRGLEMAGPEEVWTEKEPTEDANRFINLHL
jgi:hypothetical protein